MNFKQFLKKTLRRTVGLDVVQYDCRHFSSLTRSKLLEHQKINCVLDVGANVGEYGSELRECGYAGRIVSFEPLDAAYKQLQRRCSRDPLWTCEQIGLGENDESGYINVAENLVSSSYLPMLPAHLKSAPKSHYTHVQHTELQRLDSAAQKHLDANDRIWLKLDVQGYEQNVLNGSPQLLQRLCAIELELTLSPLYSHQVLYLELLSELASLQYRLVSVAPVFHDPESGLMLQFDGILLRQDAAPMA
jgi:FkbM family methyltransferase